MAFRFKNFPFYQDAKRLHKEIVLFTGNLSKENLYVVDQIRRSSLSVLLNIAEGSSKQTDKDFNRYLTIALGSVDETVASLEIMYDLGLISKDTFQLMEREYEAICRQLGGLSKFLKSKLA